VVVMVAQDHVMVVYDHMVVMNRAMRAGQGGGGSQQRQGAGDDQQTLHGKSSKLGSGSNRSRPAIPSGFHRLIV